MNLLSTMNGKIIGKLLKQKRQFSLRNKEFNLTNELKNKLIKCVVNNFSSEKETNSPQKKRIYKIESTKARIKSENIFYKYE